MNARADNKQMRRVALTGGALAAFLTAAHIVTDALTSTFTALLPTIQGRFSLSETALALLVALLSFSSLVAQPLFGTLSDRLDARLVSAAGVVLCTSLLSLLAVAPSVTVLVILLAVGGIGSAAFHPAASTLAREAGGRHAGLTVSLFSAGGTLGLALGPILVLSIIASRGLDFAPWLMVPGVILGILLYLIVPAKPRRPQTRRPRFVDRDLLIGPVGLLCLTGVFSSITSVTFSSALPLWLVGDRDVPRNAPLIGWTLASFSFAAAVGGIVAGLLSTRLSRQLLISGSMLLALVPLLGIFTLDPGSPTFFAAVAMAGLLVNAGFPLMLVTAQDLAPHAVATASGMLMGLTSGTAGLLYIGVGWLQEVIGLAPAMILSYLTLVPGAFLATFVLTRFAAPTDQRDPVDAAEAISAGVCGNVFIAPEVRQAIAEPDGNWPVAVLTVAEIGCDPCRQTITDALGRLDGVHRLRLNVPFKQVEVEYDPNQVNVDRLKAALEDRDQVFAGS